MRLRLIPLKQPTAGGPPATVAVWRLSAFGEAWLGIVPALEAVQDAGRSPLSDEEREQLKAAGADVLFFLQGAEQTRTAAEKLLDVVVPDRALWEACTAACDEEALLMPFQPKSFRDFSIYPKHMKGAARGLLSLTPGAILQVLFGVLGRVARLPLPLFSPSHAFTNKPLYYVGNHLTFIPSGAEVPWPPYAETLDYELELGLVIARPVPANAPPAEAAAAVGGAVILNDFTARDVQLREMFEGNFGLAKAKNFGTAMGCEVVTADELLPRLHSDEGLRAGLGINGREVARSCTAGADHTVADMAGYACLGEPLVPGEVLGTGTLPNCCGAENGRYLRPGDVVELAVEGFELPLTNTIGERQKHRCPAANGSWQDLVLRRGKFGRASRAGAYAALALLAALAAALFAAHSAPSKYAPVEWRPEPLTVPLDVPGRHALARAARLYEGALKGPESFALDAAGRLYLSLWDGRIVRTRGAWRDPLGPGGAPELEDFVPAGGLSPRGVDPRCGPGVTQFEEVCGRPLGLALARGGDLFVCDAYFGLLAVSPKGAVRPLANATADGRRLRFANYPVLDEERRALFLTDSSGKWRRREVMSLVQEGACDGRLVRYDLRTGEAREVAGGLCFPNGAALLPGGRALLVAETTRMRLTALDAETGRPLGAARRNSSAVIPCLPDNLSWGHGNATHRTLYVGCSNQYGLKFFLLGAIAPYPAFRRLLASIVSPDTTASLAPPYGVVLEMTVNLKGPGPLLALARLLTDPSGRVAHVAEAHAAPEGGLLLGSYRNAFLAYLPRAALEGDPAQGGRDPRDL